MNFPLFVARRYFFSKKQKNFISIISIVAMVGAALGTAALVIVLSVFNGLEDLLRSLYNSFDPELKITVVTGKSFELNHDFLKKIERAEGVAYITEVIEDNAVVKYAEGLTIVRIKGVTDTYDKQSNIKDALKEGKLALRQNGVNFALMGSTLQRMLSVGMNNDFYLLQVWYPKKQTSTSSLNPENAFNKGALKPGGVFAIEQEYDEKYMLAPLSFVEELMDYQGRRTSIEVKTSPNHNIDKVQLKLEKILGSKFRVENRDQQHASLYKAIKIEKIFGFITFSFILLIASLSIFFSLTMLGIEKKKDISVLYSMGATPGDVRKIFILVGVIIAFTGATIGLFIGYGICMLQQQFGIVSMGMQTSIVQDYPVKIEFYDFLYTGISIIIITILLSFSPAQTAAKLDLKDNL